MTDRARLYPHGTTPDAPTCEGCNARISPEIAAARVEHQLGDRQEARTTVRETAQLVDAQLEGDGDE